MEVNHSKVEHFRDQSLMLVTALAPLIGSARAANGRGWPIERACSARLGRTGLGVQQGGRVPRAGAGGRR